MRHPLVLQFAASLVISACFATQDPATATVPQNTRLFVAPMEWQLDQFVVAEIQRQDLPVKLATNAQDADFVMAGQYEALGSHLMSPGHYIRVKIVSTDGRKQVWSADANDYALFFGRMRQHGPQRAAATIVKQLRENMAAATK